MTPASRIVLLSLCAILIETDPTCGYVIRKPEGTCPPVVPGARCLPRITGGCRSSSECLWNQMCCFNGCTNVCMRVTEDLPDTTKPPFFKPHRRPDKPEVPFHRPKPQPKPLPFWPELPPTNPDDPFPIFPPQPDPNPDGPFPPIWFPPMDPKNYNPDENHLPVFRGGGGGFNFP